MTALYVDLKAICPDPELIDIWEQWNDQIWNGEQKPCWLSRITSSNYGKAAGYWFPDSRTIQILQTHWHRKTNIILHEMVHQWVSDNNLEDQKMTWKKDWGRGARSGDWKPTDVDGVHDVPNWILAVLDTMDRMGYHDFIPYMKKKTTKGHAPSVITDDRKEILVLEPGTKEYQGKPLKWVGSFPWNWELSSEELEEFNL